MLKNKFSPKIVLLKSFSKTSTIKISSTEQLNKKYLYIPKGFGQKESFSAQIRIELNLEAILQDSNHL